jgi:hypothetical protein
MANAAKRFMHGKGEQKPEGEQRALDKIRSEAKKAGATLLTDGEGGLPSSTVLGVMRRDEYKCKRCGSQENLSIHHKGGLENPVSRWLKKKGHSNTQDNLVTICGRCHDNIHEEDREEGDAGSEKSQGAGDGGGSEQ